MPCVKSHDDLPFHIHPETGKRELDAYAWPGGYPVFYVEKGFSGKSVVCRKCANHTVNETETVAENTSQRIVGWGQSTMKTRTLLFRLWRPHRKCLCGIGRITRNAAHH